MPPRRPKWPPKQLRWPQDASQTAQGAFAASDSLRMAQEAPRRPTKERVLPLLADNPGGHSPGVKPIPPLLENQGGSLGVPNPPPTLVHHENGGSIPVPPPFSSSPADDSPSSFTTDVGL
eukprot:9019353-Pyramimonas_sp.AAC.1